MIVFFFFKQKTAYDMRISDWSSDVCSSDLSPQTLNADRAALGTRLSTVRGEAGFGRGAPIHRDIHPGQEIGLIGRQKQSDISHILWGTRSGEHGPPAKDVAPSAIG